MDQQAMVGSGSNVRQLTESEQSKSEQSMQDSATDRWRCITNERIYDNFTELSR